MRRAACILIATLAFPGAALAQIDLSVCQYLPRHRPAPDVEYTPGVDVKGRAVAPADLPGSAGAAAPIERFDIPVTLNFARRMGFAVPSGGLPGNAEVGTLTLKGNRLFFNGQPVGGPSEAQLYALCRTAR
ncbi:hypothetical protein [Azospirillum soli]|uniref:hypothetical protein n=1 Tax=Azospirillum soli TaxID=1304799 RepID=UPI001AE5A8DA|nr:hypothetical protein [Azospirillum soli]MBP2312397.1 hypothetical protein [Azospirillum soli]